MEEESRLGIRARLANPIMIVLAMAFVVFVTPAIIV